MGGESPEKVVGKVLRDERISSIEVERRSSRDPSTAAQQKRCTSGRDDRRGKRRPQEPTYRKKRETWGTRAAHSGRDDTNKRGQIQEKSKVAFLTQEHRQECLCYMRRQERGILGWYDARGNGNREAGEDDETNDDDGGGSGDDDELGSADG